MQNLFHADKLAENMNRRFYRGMPTRKYRRYLKLTGGMDERQRVEVEQAFLKKMLG